MEFLAISGSLRSGSSNTATLEALALLSPPGLSIVRYRGLAALPHFNPDLEGEGLPEPVRDLRALVGRADALIISSPEYARGIAGSLQLRIVLRTMSGDIVEPASVTLPLLGKSPSPAAIAADGELAGALRNALHALSEAVGAGK
jgi:NAD(P)H-dependent FMN reductase